MFILVIFGGKKCIVKHQKKCKNCCHKFIIQSKQCIFAVLHNWLHVLYKRNISNKIAKNIRLGSSDLDDNLIFPSRWNCKRKEIFWPTFWFWIKIFKTFRLKLRCLIKNMIFHEKLDFWRKFGFLVKIWIFAENLDFSRKFGFLTKV